jgi:hypothetical protein
MLDTINVPIALPDANWSAETAVTPGKVRLLMRLERSLWLNRRGSIKAQCPRALDKQSGKEYTFRVRPADI